MLSYISFVISELFERMHKPEKLEFALAIAETNGYQMTGLVLGKKIADLAGDIEESGAGILNLSIIKVSNFSFCENLRSNLIKGHSINTNRVKI